VLNIGKPVMLKKVAKKNKQTEVFDGPYRVVQFNKKASAYRLVDATGALVSRPVARNIMKPLSGTDADKERQIHWELERIINDRGEGEEKEYLVVWKGWDGEHWLSAKNFDSKEIIREYHKRKEQEKKGQCKTCVKSSTCKTCPSVESPTGRELC
jgi:hypothetical protein